MKRPVALVLGVALGAALLAHPGAAAPRDKAARGRIRSRLGVPARIAFHPETDHVRFLGTDADVPIPRPDGVGAHARVSTVARAFLEDNGDLFGIDDQSRELEIDQVQPAPNGRSVARFQQVHHDVPVLAGEIVVGLDDEGNILQANGETSSSPDVPAEPKFAASAAAAKARSLVVRVADTSAGNLETTTPQLWIYDRDLIGGPGPDEPRLVWRLEVTSETREDVRELVLVDANDGTIVLNFSQIAEAKNRKICNANGTGGMVPCTSPFARVEGQGPTGIVDVDKAYEYSGGVYDFFKTRFKRESIDNKGMALLQTVRYCENGACPYENAFWNGKQMVYGPGYASADDVVGHEMVHGITERTAGLFYWFQAGAINESLSDVFGELYDLTNGSGLDSASVRWEMGEDLPGGAIRDMENPPLGGHPDKMTSSLYEPGIDPFDRTVTDSGGVHTNSGVNNKAAYLLTDGGSFNGRTVSPLGIDKVATLYYDVLTNALTSGSDYFDLYEGLYQSCQNLIGTSGFTSADCTEVRDATLAVEMQLQSTHNGGQFPGVEDPPMCGPGQIPTDLFYDNMEVGGKWQPLTNVGTNKWLRATGYATSGKFALYTEDQENKTDTSMAMVAPVAIPSGTTTYFRFSTATNFEYIYDWINNVFTAADGGVLEYNLGSAWTDAGGFTMDSPYWGTLGSDNPLAGRQAFTDVTGGYFANRVNISGLAGQNVKFRFRAGTDTGNHDPAFWGWVVDDVRIYTCTAGSRPGPSTANLLRNPGFEWDDDDDSYPDSWSMNTSTLRMPGLGRNGSYAMRHKTHDPEKYTSRQRVNGLSPGQSYTFNGYVKIPATRKTVSFALQAIFRNGAGKAIKTQTIKAYSDDTRGAWNLAKRTMTAPTGTASADIAMAQKGLSATVYVDDFQFKQP